MIPGLKWQVILHKWSCKTSGLILEYLIMTNRNKFHDMSLSDGPGLGKESRHVSMWLASGLFVLLIAKHLIVWPRSEREWCLISCEHHLHSTRTQMVGNYNGCRVEAAVSSYTPLPTSITISKPYHVLTKVVTGLELTLKPGGNAHFF